jgi:acetylornithine deacetylase/succinyl-diaminopimelate desuccinylase
MNKELIEIAESLIKIPGYIELEQKETEVAVYLNNILKGYGLASELLPVSGDRYNVCCRYGKGNGGKTLLLCTHLDTVPGYGMENAFAPYIRDGRLYGRGAVDVKGILAAMTSAMKRLAQEKKELNGQAVLLGVADEESGSAGMREAMRTELTKADIAVIGEPSNLELGIAHKGVMWVEVCFYGKSTHGGTPELGKNAIYYASSFIERVKTRLIPALDGRTNELVGRSTINIGTIDGGTRPTIVPDQCVIKFDRRFIPGESFQETAGELKAMLEELSGGGEYFRYDMNIILGNEDGIFPVLNTDRNDNFVKLIRQSVETVLKREIKEVGLPFWTDAALFQYYTDKPAVVLGPGSIEQAHSNHEYVEIDDLEKASDIYYQMIVDFCS